MNATWERVQGTIVDMAFGPKAGPLFDLTLSFQEYILTILPTALIILMAPFYLYHYKKQPVASGRGPLLYAKLAVAIVTFALQVAFAVLCISSDAFTGAASTPASVMTCATTAVVATLLYFEHRRAVQSSAAIALFLGITMLFDIVRTRSYFIRGDYTLLGSLYAVIVAAKLALVALEEVPKRRDTKDEHGKEANNGFWGRSLFLWLNSTIFLGFRNILSVDSLPNLGQHFASEPLAANFEREWAKRDKSQKSSLTLMKTTIWSLIWPFLSAVPARTIYVAFEFSQPLLLQRLLQWLGQEDNSEDVGRSLIGAAALSYVGVAISKVWYTHMNNQFITKVRGVLTAQILRKSLALHQDDAAKSASLTLMSTDLEGIANGLPKIHEAWSGIIELSVAIYFLATLFREAASLTGIPAIISMVLSVQIGKRLREAAREWNEQTQIRVSKTSKVLSQIRGVKMTAAEAAAAEYIQRLREAEIATSKKSRMLTVATFVSGCISLILTPVIVIAGGIFWTGQGNFDATRAFTSIAFIMLASQPMVTILTSWSKLGALVACFERIQNYLFLEERCDERHGPAFEKIPVASASDFDEFPIQFIDASMSPTKSRGFQLHVDVKFGRSTTSMIIGPTGCGKSTLLKAIISEVLITKGLVYVRKKQVAYCGQQTWLPNTAIRDIILGGLPFDRDWYYKIIEICQLLEDLNKLPNGDLTLVGSRGTSLSGGQKQRIALARAMFSHALVMVLDDALSAVDSETASAILDRLLGSQGLAKNLGMTVIMATHSEEHLHLADRILTIGHDGTVTAQNTENVLKRKDLAKLLDEPAGASKVNGDSENTHVDKAAQTADPRSEVRDLAPQQGDFSLYKYYLKSFSSRLLFAWFLMTVFFALLEKMPNVFVRIWVSQDPNNRKYFLGYSLIALLIIFTVAIWIWTFFVCLVPESSTRLHWALLDTVKRATFSFLTHTDAGSLLNRFSQDLSFVSQDLPSAFLFFIYTFFGVLADIALTLSASVYTIILLPFVIALLLFLQHFYLRTSRQMRFLDLNAKTPLYTHFMETSDGLQHIRAFGWEEETLSQGLKLLDHSQKPYYYMFCIQRWLTLVLDLTVAGIAVVLVAVAVFVGSAEQSAVGLAMLYAMMLSTQLKYLMDEWVDLETSLGALSRIRAFTKETPTEDNGDESQVGNILPADWPCCGRIELQDVTSEYGLSDGRSHVALRNLSVDITGGTKVGIVGRSGSGKTTLFLTIMNFLKYTGSVKIDGIDISTIPRHLLRSRIISISQDFMEFPSSVRDNLSLHDMNKAPNERVSDDALYQALSKVGLENHFKSRGGLDGPIEDAELSEGQKQLLALARALVRKSQTNSKIILVDEATSSIDYESEAKLQLVMDEAFSDCTVLTIAHRQQTVQGANLLLEMLQGSLVESGEEEPVGSGQDDAKA